MPSTRKRILIRKKNVVIFSHQYLQRVFHWLIHQSFISGASATLHKEQNKFKIVQQWKKPIYEITFKHKDDAKETFLFAKMLDKK